jgi:hypothetical protein
VLIGAAVLTGIFAVSMPYMHSWLFAVAMIGGQNMSNAVVALIINICIQEAASNEVRGQLGSVSTLLTPIATIGGPMLVPFLASGVFAHSGGLGTALALVGGCSSLVAVTLFALCGREYERAQQELRSLAATAEGGGSGASSQ